MNMITKEETFSLSLSLTISLSLSSLSSLFSILSANTIQPHDLIFSLYIYREKLGLLNKLGLGPKYTIWVWAQQWAELNNLFFQPTGR